jgi:hypothetical protein
VYETTEVVSIPLPRAWWTELRDCCRAISEDRPTRRQHRHPLNQAALGIRKVLAKSTDDPQTITRSRKGWVRLANILANYANKLDRLAWAAFRAIHESVIGASALK